MHGWATGGNVMYLALRHAELFAPLGLLAAHATLLLGPPFGCQSEAQNASQDLRAHAMAMRNKAQRSRKLPKGRQFRTNQYRRRTRRRPASRAAAAAARVRPELRASAACTTAASPTPARGTVYQAHAKRTVIRAKHCTTSENEIGAASAGLGLAAGFCRATTAGSRQPRTSSTERA